MTLTDVVYATFYGGQLTGVYRCIHGAQVAIARATGHGGDPETIDWSVVPNLPLFALRANEKQRTVDGQYISLGHFIEERRVQR